MSDVLSCLVDFFTKRKLFRIMPSSTIFNYESLVHATAAATGSIVAMSCFYPLDNLKFRMQLEDSNLLDKSTLQALMYLLKKEGFESWYRGIKPGLQCLGISNFIYFYSFHGLKSLLPKTIEPTAQTDLLFSIIAGIVNVITTTPLWVVNSRLRTKNKQPFDNLVDGLIHIANTEGFAALWASVGPSLILVSNPAIHFTVYEALKRRVTVKSATAFFILGALSKTVSTVVTYPLQLAQTRQRSNKDDRIGTAALLLSILKKNGPSALYQGMETKLLQTVLAAALMFMTYEKITQFVFMLLLRNRKRLSK